MKTVILHCQEHSMEERREGNQDQDQDRLHS